ncbi:MAG: AMP-binding protein [Candidatus Paceibacterota bacterium]
MGMTSRVSKNRSLAVRNAWRHSSLYRELWRAHGIRSAEDAKRSFSSLPPVTWGDLCKGSLGTRLTKNEGILIKKAERGRKTGLTAMSGDAIRAEPRLLSGVRPLVAFENIGELQQWSMWVYEHLRLPLVRSGNDELTVRLAQWYRADSLVCDARMCARLFPLLSRDGIRIKEIIVIDSDFTPLRKLALGGLRVTLALALPECGIIGISTMVATPPGFPEFRTADNVYIEHARAALYITKSSPLPIPVVRYKAPLVTSALERSMDDGVLSFHLRGCAISMRPPRTKRKLRPTVTRDIPGIGRYKPGDPSIRKLRVVYSSGTTGAPKLSIKRLENIPVSKRPALSTFRDLVYLLGSDRLAVNHFTQMVLKRDMVVARFLAISAHDVSSDSSAETLRAFFPTEIVTTPVLFRSLVAHLKSRRALEALSSLKKIILTQSIVERSTYELAKKTCPHASLLTRYGSTETGRLGVSCAALSRAKFPRYLGIATPLHPFAPVRIRRPDDRGVGELLVRRFGRWVSTGDAALLENKKCSCGENVTLMLYGRLENDRVGCMGAMFLASEVERVCSSLSRYIKDYRVAVGERGMKDPLGAVHLSVIPTPLMRTTRKTKDFVAKKFAQELRVTKSRTLAELIRDGIFQPVKVELVDEFPFTVKPLRLRRVPNR